MLILDHLIDNRYIQCQSSNRMNSKKTIHWCFKWMIRSNRNDGSLIGENNKREKLYPNFGTYIKKLSLSNTITFESNKSKSYNDYDNDNDDGTFKKIGFHFLLHLTIHGHFLFWTIFPFSIKKSNNSIPYRCKMFMNKAKGTINNKQQQQQMMMTKWNMKCFFSYEIQMIQYKNDPNHHHHHH